MLKYILMFPLWLSIIFSQDTTFICGDWEQESFGSYILENNVWGQGDITDYSQCIFLVDNGHFGWKWDWPNEGSHVKSYPEVMFGKKPWSSSSTHSSMPLKVQNVESFVVEFDLEMQASGSYNLAFEFWVTSDSLSNETGIVREVMIWTAGEGIMAAGNHISTPYFDGYFYKLYKAQFDNWIYYAFVSEEDQFEGTLYIHNFINYMSSQDHLGSGEYIANFELGNEVVHGSGQTDIKSYSVSVNQSLEIPKLKNTKFSGRVFNPAPNPFNPSTEISYELIRSSDVRVSVYDIRGKKIHDLLNEKQGIGTHSVQWSGTDHQNRPVSAGLYFCKVKIGELLTTKKILLLK
ncbi:MAG: GH12 family glycosyl hydrolase domain-containing protein [Candidatus Neomarinimicrobiota bacterium]